MLRIEGWGVNHKRVERKSRTRLRSSIVVITPERALVSARAPSTTSSSTVARSRLLADAENRRAQPGDAVVAVTVRGPASIRIVHFGLHSPPKGEASRPGSTGPPGKWKDSAVRTACHAYDM